MGWDNAFGPVIEAKIPPECTMEQDRILHYLMAIQTLSTTPIIQVQDEKESVLVYGAPTKESTTGSGFNYRFIVLILNEDEGEKAGQFKLMLSTEGKNIIDAPRLLDRQKNFASFARALLQPATHKIVFMGFPNAGKTSTKKFFFEKIHEEQLLNTTIEPTLGFESTYYQWMDLNLVLFDTAGQELDRWYDENELVLDGSDLIVFFFSVQDWEENPLKVKKYLLKLVQLRKEKIAIGRNIVGFCHKADLIKEREAEFKKEVLDFLQSINIPGYFTSLLNNGNSDLIAGMQLLLINFSNLLIDFNKLVNPLLKRHKLDPLFIMDSNGRILASYIKENDFPDTKREELKTFISDLASKYLNSFRNPLDFLTIWFKTSNTFIICTNFSVIHNEISFLFSKASSLKTISDFFDAYKELIRSFKWQREKT